MVAYSALYQDIQDWSENDDSEFTDEINTFILLAEERIFRDCPFLPNFRSSNTGNLVSGTSTLTMPTGVRTIRSFSITVSGSEFFLQQRLDSYLQDCYQNSSKTGIPKFYAWQTDTSLLLGPTPNSAYAYTVLAQELPTGLSSGNTTTWLSSNAEDVLRFAIMIEAKGFLKHPEEVDLWSKRYIEAKQSLISEVSRTIGNENTVGV